MKTTTVIVSVALVLASAYFAFNQVKNVSYRAGQINGCLQAVKNIYRVDGSAEDGVIIPECNKYTK